MSELDLLKRIEALEKKVEELEGMLNLITDIQKSETMQTAIEKKKKAVAFSTLINSLTNESSIDVKLQQQAIDEIEEEKKQTDERISESLNHLTNDMDDDTDYESLFDYNVIRWNDSDVCEITGYLGFDDESNRKLVIPETISGYKVVSIGRQAFEKCNFEEIYLPESIERIQWSAFSDCEKLRYINLPNGLESLGDSCFFNTGLVSITVPPKIKIIPHNCFGLCKNLKNVVVLGYQTELDSNCFGLSSLRNPQLTVYCNQGSKAIHDARKAGLMVKPLSQFAKERHNV